MASIASLQTNLYLPSRGREYQREDEKVKRIQKMAELIRVQQAAREEVSSFCRETLCYRTNSTLSSKPKHERCVHFHPHYKPQIYFNNMADSLEAANCSSKQCQRHFKGSRVFDGTLMLSGFGDFSEETVNWQLWSQTTMTECKLLDISTAAQPPLLQNQQNTDQRSQHLHRKHG